MISPFANAGAVLGSSKFPHIWTIAVEFQFYLTFPFLVAILSKQKPSYLFGLILMAIIIRAMMYINDGTVQDASYSTILGRFDQFIIGMGAALIYANRKAYLSSPIALAGSIGIVYLWFYAFTAWTNGGYYGTNSATSVAWIFSPTLEAIAWSVLMLSYLQQKWKMPSLADRLLSYLGCVSFSMYIWHYPIILLFRKHPEISVSSFWYIDFIAMVFPTILIVSSISYHIIEKPFFSFRTSYIKNKDARQDGLLENVKPAAEMAKQD